MKIKKLKLKNFRNYEVLDLELGPHINFIYGENAQGKTNLLEAIYLCTFAKSHRCNKDENLKKKGENFYLVELDFFENIDEKIKIIYDEKRNVFINDIKLSRIYDLIGKFNSVIFAPEDIEIIKEGPSYRRQYMDLLLSQIYPLYFRYLSRGQKLLSQKNALLKQINAGMETSELPFREYLKNAYEQARVWDEQIAHVWVFIYLMRFQLMNEIKPDIRATYDKIACEKEHIEIFYKPCLSSKLDKFWQEKNIDFSSFNLEKLNNDNKIKAELYHLFLEVLHSNFQDDVFRKQNSHSYMKDDFNILIGGNNVKFFASQGQIRSVVLSLKIAELNYLYQKLQIRPVLLLDDVLSELDHNRRKALLSFISDEQVIITCTDYEETRDFFKKRKMNDKIRFFHIKEGSVV